MAQKKTPTSKTGASKPAAQRSPSDALYVRSIEKAFRVLTSFDSEHATMSLAQIAQASELDKSAAQRFTHTLERLGYLHKDPQTRRYALTVRNLELGYHYARADALVGRAWPYLSHLSRETEETVSLTILDGTDIVYVSRFSSRHMLDTGVIVGSRLPAYCTAPGMAILSKLPFEEAHAVLRQSDLKPFTPHTVWQMPALLSRLEQAASDGYATTVEEIYPNDISIGAPILARSGHAIGAISIAVSKLRYSVEDASSKFVPVIMGAAHALS